MTDFAALREAMVRDQIERRGIAHPAILSAFRAVPREMFVRAELAGHAYSDGPLPIGHDQTVSQPYIVALMVEAAEIKAGDRVLEVGAGSGYAAAVMSRIAAEVIGVERIPELAQAARDRLGQLGHANVSIVDGDGTQGWPARAPYDAILAAASGSHVPQSFTDQLAPGGRIVMPVGRSGDVQQLIKVTKRSDGSTSSETLCSVRFVPLIGVESWSEPPA